MQLSLRLREVLKQYADHRGIIKEIADYAGLERHQVAAILHNRAKYVSLAALAGVCDYLVERHHVDPSECPGILFGRDPDDFWAMLADRQHLQLCVGVRHAPKGPERIWVMGSDAYLQGTLLHEIFGVSGTAEARRLRSDPKYSEQQLVQAPGSQADSKAVRQESEAVYREFTNRPGDRALICLGSIKSNPVAEMVLAKAFHTKPFESQGNRPKPRDRSCPIFFWYRPNDPKQPSCCGGFQLARSKRTSSAGIYYEGPNRKWICCPWNEQTDDAALVFYTYRPDVGRVEMVVGGFSGRGTRCLAGGFRTLGAKLWPPSYSTPQLQVGAFIVRFRFGPPAGRARAQPGRITEDQPSATEVVSLSRQVLLSRLEA